MELDSKEILKVLKEKGVDTLHHSNTVQTSCLFLQHGRILSRGTVDERHWNQTAQSSDKVDKKFGIWYDIFLDSVDIHQQVHGRNFYGPVLFRFNLDLLNEQWLPSLWITKKNPVHWKDGESPGDRYYSSVAEFAKGYTKGEVRSMFMLRHAGGVLRLLPHLKDIVLDDPGWEYRGIDIYSQTVGALRASAMQGGFTEIDIIKRECTQPCRCTTDYAEIRERFERTKANKSQTGKLFFFMSKNE